MSCSGPGRQAAFVGLHKDTRQVRRALKEPAAWLAAQVECWVLHACTGCRAVCAGDVEWSAWLKSEEFDPHHITSVLVLYIV